MIRGILIPAALLGCAMPPVVAAEVSPAQLYGDEIRFEVRRNGETVGAHRVTFSGDNEQLTVTAKTQAAISFYGLFDSDFVYDSEALWRNGELDAITASHIRMGNKSETALRRLEDGHYQTAAGKTVPPPLFPTNHWHIGVLAQTRIFNTLNGRVGQVSVTPEEEEQITLISGVQLTAQRYRYRGDLDVEAWYDDDGRWVKLRFHTLGADYEFVCETCQAP